MNKTKIIVIGALIVAVLALTAYILTHQPQANTGAVLQGASNTNAVIAEQSFNSPATTTIFSQFNGDDNNRLINDLSGYVLNTAALGDPNTSYVISCSTSTLPYGGVVAATNNNYVFNDNINLTFGSTTSPGSYLNASSAPGIIGANGILGTSTRVWNAGSYLVCSTTPTLTAGEQGYIKMSVSRQ